MLRLSEFEKYSLTFGPTPIEQLPRMTEALGGKLQTTPSAMIAIPASR